MATLQRVEHVCRVLATVSLQPGRAHLCRSLPMSMAMTLDSGVAIALVTITVTVCVTLVSSGHRGEQMARDGADRLRTDRQGIRRRRARWRPAGKSALWE